MKLLTVLCLLLLLSSCKMLHNSGIEKRRYQPGFYHSSPTAVHSEKKEKKDKTKFRKQLSTDAVITEQVATITPEAEEKIAFEETTTAVQPINAKKTETSISGQRDLKKGLNNYLKERPKQKLRKHKKKRSTSAATKRSYYGSSNSEKGGEALGVLIFTILDYAFAFLLINIFPALSLTAALGWGALCIIALILILALILFPIFN